MTGLEITKKIKESLSMRFGDIVEKIILFGSRSRGTSSPDSDYDLLIVLRSPYDWRLANSILDSCYEIGVENDLLTDIKLISVPELNTLKGAQPFIQQAFAEGIAV